MANNKMATGGTDMPEPGIGSKKVNYPSHPAQTFNFAHDVPILVEDTQKEAIDGHVQPLGGALGDGPYEFILPASQDTYLMMNSLNLYARAKIVDEEGDDLEKDVIIGPINCLGATMWEHTEVSLNDFVLSGASSTNTHYKQYLETITSYDAVSKDTHLRTQFFIMDTAGHYSDFKSEAEAGLNLGFRLAMLYYPKFCSLRITDKNSLHFE